MTTATSGLTPQAVAEHLADMLPRARLLPLGALRGEVEVGCVDGRNHGCVIGAPGGNAGLLVTLAGALEETRGAPLTPDEAARLLQDYLAHFGSFYLHTDEHAARRLEALVVEGSVVVEGSAGEEAGAEEGGVASDVATLEALHRCPPAALRSGLLAALEDPRNVGCGHLARLLEDPPGLRPGLPRLMLRTIFQALWDGDERIRFEVLPGSHHEEGVLRVHAASEDLLATCPHHGLREFFVLHPDAVRWLEMTHARFAIDAGWIPERLAPALVARQGQVADESLAATLSALAPGLPVFDVRVAHGANGPTLNVTEAGHIPLPSPVAPPRPSETP